MSYFKTVDGFTLHYLVDRAEQAQTKALLLHGYGEHTQRYDRFISELIILGLVFYVLTIEVTDIRQA